MASEKIAFVFPGQGSQAVGMGKDLAQEPEGKIVFESFDRAFQSPDGRLPLSQVCFEGPEDTLRRTLYTQPAILATSLAALEVFRSTCAVTPTLVAGHSLGEYGALYAAGVISLGQAAQLIEKRASLMEMAPTGTMAAVLGLKADAVDSILSKWRQANANGIVAMANDNSDGQVVISGEASSIETVTPKLKEAGAKRILPLPVGGAFHSPLMHPAAESFGKVLNDFDFNDARCGVVSNIDAAIETSGALLRKKLALQIDHSVLWTPTMRRMIIDQAVTTVIEFGPGKVLTGLFGRMFPDLRVINVSDVATSQAAADLLNAR